MTDEDTADRNGPDPTDAFALVGNETRAEILRALGDARVEERFPPELSFSELRDRADVDVPSSQFNYHLQQLIGHYLQHDEEGYRMRAEGRRLYQTLRAGTFDPTETVDAVDSPLDCHHCGTEVEATIEEGLVRVECPSCEYVYGLSGAPPSALGAESVDFQQVGAYYHHRHLAFARGVCDTCGDDLDTRLVSPDSLPFADPDRQELYVYRSCGNCGDQRHLSLGTALLPDPRLRAFCLDHGVDVLATPIWELEFAATDSCVTVHSTDPWEVELAVTYDDETLSLVVDGDLNVLEHHRE